MSSSSVRPELVEPKASEAQRLYFFFKVEGLGFDKLSPNGI